MTQALPSTTLSQFTARLKAKQRRIPLQATLETTFRCNLRCVHCYVNEPVASAEIRAQEQSLEQLKQLIDDAVDAGCLELLLTGGEVLVRPDFEALYLYAISRGLLVVVFTNGTLVTEKIAELFDRARPFRIEITLYGMSQATYDKVTQVPGSYDKCIAGIERLVAKKLPLKLKTMALTWNQHEVRAMQAYAESLGLEFKFDGFLNPRVDCGANRNQELQLGAEQLIALDLADPQRMEDFRVFCQQFVPPPDKTREQEFVYTCGAGATSFTVDPYGKMQMCQLSRKASFDLKQGSFSQGWNEFFPMLRARKWQSNSVCRKCNLISLCASCPGAAEMEHGNIESMVEQFCEMTHLRAHVVMGEKSGHRKDGTCCLGHGKLASQPASLAPSSSCTGCSASATHAPTDSPLIALRTPVRTP